MICDLLTGIFIVGAKRTAFGTFGGAFKNVTATQLQTAACKATLDSAGVSPEQVDSVIIGNVLAVLLFYILSGFKEYFKYVRVSVCKILYLTKMITALR